MRLTQDVTFNTTLPRHLIWAIAVEARLEAVTVLVDGPYVLVTTIVAENQEEAASRVNLHMLKIMDALLDEGLIQEEEIVEPRKIQNDAGALPAFGGSSPTQCVEGGMTPPAEPIPALRLLEWFCPDTTGVVSHLCAQGNVSWDGKSAWVGLLVRQVRSTHFRMDTLDGHITLFYLNKSAVEKLDVIVERLQAHLRTATGTKRFEFRGVLNLEYATDDYCWLDLIVHTALNGTLHNMVAIALQPPVWKRHVVTKRATPSYLAPTVELPSARVPLATS